MRAPEPYDDRTFMEKYGMAVLVCVLVLIGGGLGVGFYFFQGKIPPPKKPEEIMVRLLPPPLPPPPPPPPPPKIPPPPKEQKMVELKPQDKTPPKPEAKVDRPPGPPGPKANGPPSDDGIGGAGGNGGDGIGGGDGGSLFGYYASQVGEQVRTALERNDKTRNASFHVKLRIWFDTTGRITRSKLSPSTGDAAIDSAIQDQVLASLQLAPPPQGMPPTIAMNLNEVRPN